MILLPLFLGSALAASNPEAPAPAATPAIAPLSSLATALVQDDEEEEPDGLWHGSVNIGLSKSEGNADVETYALTAKGVRHYDVHRYTLEALYYFQRQSGIISQRRALVAGKYDQFFAEKTYFWLNALLETNSPALLDFRWVLGAGIGHQWRDDEEWRINTEIGLAYFNEDFGDSGDQDYISARVAADIWKRITDTLVFGAFAEFYPSLEDANDIYGRGEAYFEAQLTERMTARLSYIGVYDNTPATNVITGVQADRLDSVYLLNIGWTF